GPRTAARTGPAAQARGRRTPPLAVRALQPLYGHHLQRKPLRPAGIRPAGAGALTRSLEQSAPGTCQRRTTSPRAVGRAATVGYERPAQSTRDRTGPHTAREGTSAAHG